MDPRAVALRVVARFVRRSWWLARRRSICPITLERVEPPIHWHEQPSGRWQAFSAAHLASYIHTTGDRNNPVTRARFADAEIDAIMAHMPRQAVRAVPSAQPVIPSRSLLAYAEGALYRNFNVYWELGCSRRANQQTARQLCHLLDEAANELYVIHSVSPERARFCVRHIDEQGRMRIRAARSEGTGPMRDANALACEVYVTSLRFSMALAHANVRAPPGLQVP